MPAAWRSPRPMRRALRLIARRTWRFFETFVTAGRQHAAAGQLPGGSQPRRRPSDIADQYRASPALDRRRPRFRLDRHARGGRTSRGDVRDHGTPEALPRPFLQLVRHGRSSSARAALHLLGRQRQPRRPPDRARQRLRGVARHSRRCDRHRRRRRRQPRARPRGARRRCPTTGVRSSSRRANWTAPLDDLAAALLQPSGSTG